MEGLLFAALGYLLDVEVADVGLVGYRRGRAFNDGALQRIAVDGRLLGPRISDHVAGGIVLVKAGLRVAPAVVRV